MKQYYRLADDPEKAALVSVEITSSDNTPIRISDSASFPPRATFSENALGGSLEMKKFRLSGIRFWDALAIGGTRKVGQCLAGNE